MVLDGFRLAANSFARRLRRRSVVSAWRHKREDDARDLIGERHRRLDRLYWSGFFLVMAQRDLRHSDFHCVPTLINAPVGETSMTLAEMELFPALLAWPALSLTP